MDYHKCEILYFPAAVVASAFLVFRDLAAVGPSYSERKHKIIYWFIVDVNINMVDVNKTDYFSSEKNKQIIY